MFFLAKVAGLWRGIGEKAAVLSPQPLKRPDVPCSHYQDQRHNHREGPVQDHFHWFRDSQNAFCHEERQADHKDQYGKNLKDSKELLQNVAPQ